MMYDIAMIGLAVMGENLALNIESRGFSVIGYDIDLGRMTTFAESRAKDRNIHFATDLADLAGKLSKPRKIMIMIRAGKPVDAVLEQLIPFLEIDDIVIDGGNSNFHDTIRRTAWLAEHGIQFIGAGVSGGEEGALHGPSIMPGGNRDAWPRVKGILQAIAARTDRGAICCDWVGSDGAGHFVKMVHNGIEYGDIQLITEIYHLMRDLLGMTATEMADAFETWNQGPMNSYLIEITTDILRKQDTDGTPLLDKILDVAGQKGTGRWTVVTALDEGVPLSLIGEAVFARTLSARKDERIKAARQYGRTVLEYDGDKQSFVNVLQDALYAAKIISYAQGFDLMRTAADTYGWNLDYGRIAELWRSGCIIRSAFLDDIKAAYDRDRTLPNLMLDPFFQNEIGSRLNGWRHVVSEAVLHGVPVPALSAGLSYFDGYTTKSLPANLLQAMRDYFGAHTYERVDRPRGEHHHTDWTGQGGVTSSTTYEG